MSNLTGFYELSLWQDVFQTDGSFKEERLMIIGSSEMSSQARALEPKFTENVNGSHNLNFKMYYRYVDTLTGKTIDNPFVSYITNETKLKLNYQNKWYDLIVKSISENSADYSYTYSAIDYHINELSKNGFGITIDTALENNTDTVKNLGERILKGSGWLVNSESIPQLLEEALVEIVFTQDTTIENVVQLQDTQDLIPVSTSISIKENEKIYIFYSCLKNETDRLQFIYGSNLQTDNNRVIISKNCQYYLDGIYLYSIPDKYKKFGLKKPDAPFMENTSNDIKISEDFRAKRYVFSRKTIYNSVLDKYVTVYLDQNDEEVHMFEETVYQTPSLVESYVTNSEFESTMGWTGQYLSTASVNDDGSLTATMPNKAGTYAVKIETITTPTNIIDDLINGQDISQKTYNGCLKATFPEQSATGQTKGVLINSGFYDKRTKIENLNPGQKFVLFYKIYAAYNGINSFTVTVGEKKYITSYNCYIDHPSNQTFLTFDVDNSQNSPANNYYEGYVVAIIPETYNLTEIEFLAKKSYIFITTEMPGTMYIEDFQIFPYISDGKGSFIKPEDAIDANNTKVTKNYYYFNPNSDINKNAVSRNGMCITKTSSPMPGLKHSYLEGAEKTVTISVKQSNYFNGIHSLCEAAECWPDFLIEREEDGSIISKTVFFRNYIGQNNYQGFKYGVNLKEITRQINSNSIVTKLIVPDNVNEHANNGFCTIARAASNETGENYIYDFSYYLNLGLLNRESFLEAIYVTLNARGKDVNPEDEETNYYGYYTRLSAINAEMDSISDELTLFSTPLTEAKAELKMAEAGLSAAEDEFKNAAAKFLQLAGFDYSEINTQDRQTLVSDNDNINGYLQEVATQSENISKFSAQKIESQQLVDEYQQKVEDLNNRYEELKQWKTALNDAFYKQYSRFIQEGTWKDDAAIDDEKYFINAQAVAYTSSKPLVTYSIKVVELQSLPEFENIKFNLADRTWIEDVEFFGEDENGNPIREEIVLTEITHSLDNPDGTSIKVQNFKNQFQDLFQRITAQVQSVNYSSGAWNNAAAFVEADPETQSQILQEALNSAELVLSNSVNQSVVQDIDGITITDLAIPNQKLRLTSGAILLSDTNDGGEEIWKVGLTAKGISASNITAGSINTDKIQIMNDTEPCFRWDKYGITAYDFTIKQEGPYEYMTDYSTNRGVRFDRFGLYGFSGINGATWHPTNLAEVKENSIFSLTWDGLFLKLGNGIFNKCMSYIPKIGNEDAKLSVVSLGENYIHNASATIGYTDGVIYNSWITEGDFQGMPYYDPDSKNSVFTKIFSIGKLEAGDKKHETLVIYDDGTLVAENIKLTGSIVWTSMSSPSKTVYATATYVGGFDNAIDSLPPNGKRYNEFNETESDGSWHTIMTNDDSYYAHTDDGGSTWEGPILITGRSIVRTEITYAAYDAGTPPEEVPDIWSPDRPEEVGIGQNIYTKIIDIFNDGSSSTPRYNIEAGRSAEFELSRYASSVPADQYGNYTGSLLKSLSTVKVYIYDESGTEISTNNTTYTWSVSGGTLIQTNQEESSVTTEKPSNIKEVCLKSMSEDSAVITVTVKIGGMTLGTQSCTITKSRQGNAGSDALWCYISSSEGTAFQSGSTTETTLTAYLLEKGLDIDAGGTGFDYLWWNKTTNGDQPFKNAEGKQFTGKTIRIALGALEGVRLYFTATKKNTTKIV